MYVTENKIRIRKFYRTSVVNRILVLEINIFHLAYLSYILRIHKMSANDEKRTLPQLKTQQDWKEEFPFLVFTSTSMTCAKFGSKIMGCKNYNPSFVNGSTKFGKSAVKNHANTMMHSEAVKLDKIEKAKEAGEKYVTKLTPTGRAKIGESFKKSGSMTDAPKEYFEKLFHVASSVTKRGRPYTNFMDINELEKFIMSNSFQEVHTKMNRPVVTSSPLAQILYLMKR